jgi:hypothetical protein
MDDITRRMLGDSPRSTEYAAEAEAYEEPILASVCRVYGWLSLIATVIAVIWLLKEGIMGRWSIVAIAGSCFLSALASFGMAQLVEYVAIIAHNSENGKSAEMLAALQKIESHLAVLEKAASGKINSLPQKPPSVTPPSLGVSPTEKPHKQIE